MTSQPRDCDHCHRRIGARRTHYIATTTTGPVVVCVRCLGRGDHHRAYPDCPHQWHDMHDHGLSLATRAAVPWVLAARPAPDLGRTP